METDFYPDMTLGDFKYEPVVNEMKPAVVKNDMTREVLIRALRKALNYSPSYYNDFYGLVLVTSKKKLRRLCRDLFRDGDKYYKKLMRVNGYLSNGNYVDIDNECVMYPIVDAMSRVDVEEMRLDFNTGRIQFKMRGKKTWER